MWATPWLAVEMRNATGLLLLERATLLQTPGGHSAPSNKVVRYVLAWILATCCPPFLQLACLAIVTVLYHNSLFSPFFQDLSHQNLSQYEMSSSFREGFLLLLFPSAEEPQIPVTYYTDQSWTSLLAWEVAFYSENTIFSRMALICLLTSSVTISTP